MTKAAEQTAVAARRCPECGVESKSGSKYCDFCGRKLAAAAPPAAGGTQARSPRRPAAGILAGLAVVCLAVGLFVLAQSRLGEREPPPAPPPSGIAGKRQAGALCESHIRQQVRAPFRLIAFRSALVGEERGGYLVSGTAELQSAAGELQRRKYWCRVRPDAGAGMIVDEGKLY